MLNTEFSPWPSFSQEEVDAVARVLASNRVNYWTGEECRLFEKEFAVWSESEYAIAVSNGTVALDLALNALDIGPGDEVIVTPRTFLASASCVVTAGAIPVFAEVDYHSGNITAETIAAVLTPKTKAVIAVHLAGWPCDMDPIMELADKHGFYVIEDCAQAHGTRYKGKSVGSIGHIGAWSFCQDKIMTTGGEGGMVTTNNRDWWSKMWSYKDHGKSWEAVYERPHPPGFRWVHDSFGTNWRMLEMQGVIGRIQLQRMADWTAARTHNANMLRDAARPFTGENGIIRMPELNPESIHGEYKFYLYVKPEKLADGWNRDKIIAEINAHGVPCYQGSCSEVYLEKAFDGTDWRPAQRFAVARELGETSIMMLVHPTLTQEEMDKSAAALSAVLAEASGA